MGAIQSPKEPKLDDENAAVPFTARLMAYYRAQESKEDRPLIVDPFAERLAGDLTSYAIQHPHVCGSGDYPLVRSYYIENNLLTPWCHTQANSQIVLLGAGLDTRAYRFKPLQINTHTLFEVDFPIVNRYKEEILHDEQPLCELVRLSMDLSNPDWTSHLINDGFSRDTPTFWVLEGLVYYMGQEIVTALLKKAAEISTKNSQIFADLCVPALAELIFGPFTTHFKWGLDKKAVPSFFATAGWKVSCSFADDHDQGRDVGQRGLMFIHGVRDRDLLLEIVEEPSAPTPDRSSDVLEPIRGPELQAFVTELMKQILPEVEGIVAAYQRDPEEGLPAYLNFIKRVTPSLAKIIAGLRDPRSVGLISPRLLRDPRSFELMIHRRSREEEEAHIVGYLKAILQLGYCVAKGLDPSQFTGTSLHTASLKIQTVGKIHIIPALVQMVRQELGVAGD